jgi:tetrahydromethanopterin S-methyltransferase subunit B
MNNMITKLSSVAALLGVVGAIGAGFVQYGKLTAKIDELDNRKAVINETVDLDPIIEKIATLEVDLIDRIQEVENKIKPTDLTGLLKSIQEVREQVAGLKIPNVKPINDSIKELEEYAWELEEDIEQLSKDVAIVQKENQLQDVLIEEVKKSTSNPLGG